MKKLMVTMVVLVSMLVIPTLGSAQQLRLMGVAGLGQGGLGGEEVNEFDYFYSGLMAEVPLEKVGSGVSWRMSAFYNTNKEESSTEWDSSMSGFSERIETIRLTMGPTREGKFTYNEVEGWYSNNLSAGVDFITSEGIQAGVVQDDFLIGMGSVYNHLHASYRFGDEEYEFVYISNSSFLRITNWFAVGPKVNYVFFNQDQDGDGEVTMVYEPSFGGQMRFSENAEDPKYSFTVGATSGNYVGSAWSMDFWLRF